MRICRLNVIAFNYKNYLTIIFGRIVSEISQLLEKVSHRHAGLFPPLAPHPCQLIPIATLRHDLQDNEIQFSFLCHTSSPELNANMIIAKLTSLKCGCSRRVHWNGCSYPQIEAPLYIVSISLMILLYCGKDY